MIPHVLIQKSLPDIFVMTCPISWRLMESTIHRRFVGYDSDFVIKLSFLLTRDDILGPDGIEDENIGIQKATKAFPYLTFIGVGAAVGFYRFAADVGCIYNPETDECELPDMPPNSYFDTTLNMVLPIEPYPITNYKTVWRPYRADWQIIDHE
jgi:hypothetical protein